MMVMIGWLTFMSTNKCLAAHSRITRVQIPPTKSYVIEEEEVYIASKGEYI